MAFTFRNAAGCAARRLATRGDFGRINSCHFLQRLPQTAAPVTFSSFHTSIIAREQQTERRSAAPKYDSRSTIFIGNLPIGVKKEVVKDELDALGATSYKAVRVLSDLRKGRVAYGFIDCASPADADALLAKIPENWGIQGRTVFAEISKGGTRGAAKGERGPKPEKLLNNSVLYFGKLPESVRKDDIEDVVSALDGFKSVWTPFFQESPLGKKYLPYAFVHFASMEQAEKALAQLKDTCRIHGRPVRVEFSARSKRDGQAAEEVTSETAEPQQEAPSSALIISNFNGTVDDISRIFPDFANSITEHPQGFHVQFSSAGDATLAYGTVKGTTAPDGGPLELSFAKDAKSDESA